MVKINFDEFTKIAEFVTNKLLDETEYGGAWFHSEEELDEWAGDVLYDVIEYTLNSVGIKTE